MKAVISRFEILAALIFASEDDARFVLNSVCLTLKRNSQPVLVATDGRRLAVIKSQALQEEAITAAHTIILRADFLKAICALSKTLGGKIFPWIIFENKPGSKVVSVEFMGAKCSLVSEENALVEGEYPDWRACLPGKSEREAITDIGLNAAMIGDFAKAARLLDCGNPVIQMNLVGKEKQVEVKIPGVPHFYGLVMQCKLDPDTDYQPEFLAIVENLPEPPAKDTPAGEENPDDQTTVELSSGGKTTGPIPLKKFTAAARAMSRKKPERD